MSTVVTQRAEFEACYLMPVAGQPWQLNVHNYKVEVSVKASDSDPDTHVGIEFSDLKRILTDVIPDGKFLYNINAALDSPEREIAGVFVKYAIPTRSYPFTISAENLVKQIAEDVQERLYALLYDACVAEVKLRETSQSFVTWRRGAILGVDLASTTT